jgi:Domain of unknown function (DUF4276)
MKRLVLLGEGHGEVSALPILVRKLVQEKYSAGVDWFVDGAVIRTNSSSLVQWDRQNGKPDYSKWISRIELAARRREVGGVLAIYDGDFASFPPGSGLPFCAATAAKKMAKAALAVGAGTRFSLSVVFARSEYETWLIAGVESLAGRRLADGRMLIPGGIGFPAGDPEAHGKRWLESHCPSYRPARDQSTLTELLDLQCIRAKNLRSFRRLENAVDQLHTAMGGGSHIATPR